MADDWLWLAYGQDAFTHPELFFDRPVYGYLRPVYLLYTALLIKVFGPNAFLINLGTLALHVLNCHLFFRLLVRLGGRDAVAAMATFFFAFYALSCTSVCWISAGSDLLALGLLLGFCHVLIDYHRYGGAMRLVILLVLGLASALSKEFGFLSIGLFFAYFLLRRENPFGRRYLPGVSAMLILYAAYIVYYFTTRTVVEKELILSWKLPVNLWYLCIYLILPLSRRTVSALGETVKVMLLVLRTAVTLAAPLAWLWIWVKNGFRERFFLIWPLLILLPIAMFDALFGTFSLYPIRSASRYMYGAVPGAAVLVAVTAVYIGRKWLPWRALHVVALLAFLAGNLVVVHKVTEFYRTKQTAREQVYGQLEATRSIWSSCRQLYIYADDERTYRTIFGQQPELLEAMCYLISGSRLSVSLGPPERSMKTDSTFCSLEWVTDEGRFRSPGGDAP